MTKHIWWHVTGTHWILAAKGNLFHSYGSLMAHLVWFSIAMVSFQRLTRWSMMHMPCLKGWLWDASVGTTNHSICHKTRRIHWKEPVGHFPINNPVTNFPMTIRMTLKYFYFPICHVWMTWKFDQFTQWSSGIWLVSLMKLSVVPFESMVWFEPSNSLVICFFFFQREIFYREGGTHAITTGSEPSTTRRRLWVWGGPLRKLDQLVNCRTPGRCRGVRHGWDTSMFCFFW